MSSDACASSTDFISYESTDTQCDLCSNKQDKVEAANFCSDCHKQLCSRCTKSHRKSKASKTHDISAIQQKVKVGRKESLKVSRILSKKAKRCCFTDMKVQNFSQVDINESHDKKTPWISGCDVMPDGRVILCDGHNYKVTVLNSFFIVTETLKLTDKPWDVSVINKNSAVVTLPGPQHLNFIHLGPSLYSGRVLKLDKRCWGIDVSGEHIYISLHDYKDGEIRILDIEGNLKRKVVVNGQDSFMFHNPYYLTVSAVTGNIYVSDVGSHTITCLKSDGSFEYQCKDKDLQFPRGVCIDDKENIIVCDQKSNDIPIINSSGTKQCNLLTSKNGLKDPCCVAYRYVDNTLIIGSNSGKLLVFKMAS